MKLGMLSRSGINMPWYKFCPFGAGLGIWFSQTGASHNKHDGFREGTSHLWGRNDIHYLWLLPKNFSCQHRTTGVLCYFFDFPGFVRTVLCIKWVFNAFMCIIQIWTTCTCSSAYKLVEKSNMCPCACLGPMQEMGMNFKHQGTIDCRQNIEMPSF